MDKLKEFLPLLAAILAVGGIIFGFWLFERSQRGKNTVSTVSASAESNINYRDYVIEIPLSYSGFLEYGDDMGEYFAYMRLGTILYNPYTKGISYTAPHIDGVQNPTYLDHLNSEKLILSSFVYVALGEGEGERVLNAIVDTQYLSSSKQMIDNVYCLVTATCEKTGLARFEIRLNFVDGSFTRMYVDLEVAKTGHYACSYGRNYGYSVFGFTGDTVEYFTAFGRQEGYAEGVEDGNAEGYEIGYHAGYVDGEDNALLTKETITDGFFSIIDAPFRVIRDALNFEILGFNVADAVFFILTAIIIGLVVKFLWGLAK